MLITVVDGTAMVGELRARQIVHLHRLFRVIATEFESEGMSEERLESYREQEVSPNDFKATKTDHEDALMTLSEVVSEWVEEVEEPEEDSPPKRRTVEAGVKP
jgi:hypothetical protein